jgi:hypothetical protein
MSPMDTAIATGLALGAAADLLPADPRQGDASDAVLRQLRRLPEGRLGGRNVYGSRVEDRPTPGSGRTPVAYDIAAALRLSRAVQLTAALLAVAGRLTRPRP